MGDLVLVSTPIFPSNYYLPRPEALPRRRDDRNSSRGSDSDTGNGNSSIDTATSSDNDNELADLLEYSIAGHSGDTPCEVLVDFPSNAPLDSPSSPDRRAPGEKQEYENSQEKGFFGFLKRKKEAGVGTRSGALNEKAKMEVCARRLYNPRVCY